MYLNLMASGARRREDGNPQGRDTALQGLGSRQPSAVRRHAINAVPRLQANSEGVKMTRAVHLVLLMLGIKQVKWDNSPLAVDAATNAPEYESR